MKIFLQPPKIAISQLFERENGWISRVFPVNGREKKPHQVLFRRISALLAEYALEKLESANMTTSVTSNLQEMDARVESQLKLLEAMPLPPEASHPINEIRKAIGAEFREQMRMNILFTLKRDDVEQFIEHLNWMVNHERFPEHRKDISEYFLHHTGKDNNLRKISSQLDEKVGEHFTQSPPNLTSDFLKTMHADAGELLAETLRAGQKDTLDKPLFHTLYVLHLLLGDYVERYGRLNGAIGAANGQFKPLPDSGFPQK